MGLEFTLNTPAAIGKMKGVVKDVNNLFAGEVQVESAVLLPKETRAMLKSWQKPFHFEVGNIVGVDVGYTAPYAARQHYEKLRHLPNYASETPAKKMAKLSNRWISEIYMKKFPNSTRRFSTRHASQYSLGYKYMLMSGGFTKTDIPFLSEPFDNLAPKYKKLLEKRIAESFNA